MDEKKQVDLGFYGRSIGRSSNEAGYPDAWICRCGNRPEEDGFYPCDEAGDLVEPTPQEWASGLYVCFRCGATIDPETLTIVGQADSAVVQSDL